MIFYNPRRNKIFNEADIDGAGETNNQSTDYNQEIDGAQGNTTENQDTQNTTPTDTTGTQNTPDTGTENEIEYQGGDTTEDYTTDSGDDETGNDNTSSSSSENSGNNESPVDDLKSQEEELYRNLTPEQLDIKHSELKNNYLVMYDNINSIIERISNASVDEKDIPVIEYISNTLSRLKDMLIQYMDTTYKTKSYISNAITYNRFLVVLNSLNNIFNELNLDDK